MMTKVVVCDLESDSQRDHPQQHQRSPCPNRTAVAEYLAVPALVHIVVKSYWHG